MPLRGLGLEEVAQRQAETNENGETANRDDGQQRRLQPQNHAADQHNRHAERGRQVPRRHAGRPGLGLCPGLRLRRLGLRLGLGLTFDEIRR